MVRVKWLTRNWIFSLFGAHLKNQFQVCGSYYEKAARQKAPKKSFLSLQQSNIDHVLVCSGRCRPRSGCCSNAHCLFVVLKKTQRGTVTRQERVATPV